MEQAEDLEDSEELILMTKKFVNSANDVYYRKTRQNLFFGSSGIVTLLTPEEYHDFIAEFNNQPSERVIRTRDNKRAIVEKTIKLDKKGLVDFWELYLQRPDVIADIEERALQREREQDAEQKLREAVDELESDEEVDEEVDEEEKSSKKQDEEDGPAFLGPKKKIARSTIMVEIVTDGKGKPILGKDGKPILRPIDIPERTSNTRTHNKSNPYANKCIREQRSAPWIEEGKVRGCFVLAINVPNNIKYKYGDKKDGIEVHITTGPYKDKTMIFNRAKPAFYHLLCNRQSGRNEQEDQVLHTRTVRGEALSFYVAYRIVADGMSSRPSNREKETMESKGWKWTNKNGEWEKTLIQDRKMAAQKAAWYQRTKETRSERLASLMKGPVTDSLIAIGSKNILDALRLSTGIDGGIQETFSQEASEEIAGESHDAGEYISRLSTILAYLQESEIFRDRVSQGWYNPSTFVSLTPKQMLPHSKLDDDSAESRRNSRILLSRKNRIYTRISQLYYQLEHPTERIPTRPTVPFFGGVHVEQWRDKCVNKEDITEVPDYRLVTYEEDDKVYCLDINRIAKQIRTAMLFEGDLNEIVKNEDDDFINPYTNKPLREEFLQAIIDNFDSIDWQQDSEDEEEPQDSEEEKVSTPSVPIEEMLAPGLIDLVLSNVAECRRELEDEELEEDGRCPALDNTQNSEEKEDEDESSSEEDDESTSSEEEDERLNLLSSLTQEVGSSEDEDIKEAHRINLGLDEVSSEDEFSPKMGMKCESCGKSVNPDTAYKTKKHNAQGSYDTCYFCPGEECMSKTKFKFKKGGKKGGMKGGRQNVGDKAK